jgi:hypothetical protein
LYIGITLSAGVVRPRGDTDQFPCLLAKRPVPAQIVDKLVHEIIDDVVDLLDGHIPTETQRKMRLNTRAERVIALGRY